MIILNSILFFFLGAVFASFINATVYRVRNGYKYPEIFVRRSHCEQCNHPLSSLDLFPIIGFVANKGKCKYCKTNINIFYPLSELFLGTSFLLFYLNSSPFYYFLITSFLLILSIYDIQEMGIPKIITNIFLAFCILIFFFFQFNIESLLLPTIIVVFFLIINIIKKSFGVGDILVIFGLGILLNQSQCISFFWLSVIIALVYAVLSSSLQKQSLKGMKIPMVPFISLSFVIASIYGEVLWQLVLKLSGIS